MTVTGGDAPDDQTRPDREPPVFPSVGDSPTSVTTASDAPLFTSAAEREAQSVEPVATQRTTTSTSGGRWRWAFVGIATLLVVAVVGGVLLLARPQAGTPSAVALYAPADSAGYVELRYDLPGDQHANLASFMSHFPGWADPSTFDQKLDETLNQLLKQHGGELDWTTDVEPWFGGQVAAFGSTFTPTAGTPPSMVLVLSVKDRAKLDALITEQLGSTTVDIQDYQGQQIRTITPADGDERVSFVVTNEALVAGTRIEDVQAALDVHAGQKPGLAQDSSFLEQLGKLHADRLATFYADTSDTLSSMPLPSGASGLPAACMDAFQSAGKVKYVGEVRAEGDHMAFTAHAQPPADANLPPLPANKESQLAQSMPADALAYAEIRQVGSNVGWLAQQLLDCIPASTDNGPATDPTQLLEQFLGSEPGDYFDFLDDAAFAVTSNGGVWGGGLVATVNDGAVAQQRVQRLLSLLTIFGGEGSGVTVDEVDHNGTKVTVIKAAELREGVPPLSIQIAVANNRLYLGLNDFVTQALDRTEADSLAAKASYQKAIAAGGASNAGAVYVDLRAMLALREAEMPADKVQDYETNIKPFLEPLTTLSVVNRVEGNSTITNVFVFVE